MKSFVLDVSQATVAAFEQRALAPLVLEDATGRGCWSEMIDFRGLRLFWRGFSVATARAVAKRKFETSHLDVFAATTAALME